MACLSLAHCSSVGHTYVNRKNVKQWVNLKRSLIQLKPARRMRYS